MTSKYERPNHLFKATSQFNANHVFRSDLICSSSVSGPKVLKDVSAFCHTLSYSEKLWNVFESSIRNI